MDCQRANEEIRAAAFQDPQELSLEVQQHLELCTDCRVELQTQQETWALLAAALPQAAPSQALEERLMERVRANPNPTLQFSQRTIFLKYALAAGILFLLVSGTLFRLSYLARNQPAVTDDDINQIREFAVQMDKLDELQRVFASPQLKYVSLNSTTAASVSCYLVHDPFSNQVHFFARNLEAPDTQLRVWFLDSNEQVLSAATLATKQPLGSAVLTVDNITEIAAAVVTIESSNQPERPSSDVVFRADVVGL